ncbi:MAG: hypothetical protein H0X17_01380, partial [Deltaproteobacteria bacterium]|nr:hypothetical protein [Deltaproteobacteria bacterium]
MSALVELGFAAKSAVMTLGMMAVQGTVLAAIALALAVVRGGRLRPAWQAAIWLVVLAKFVLPWGPAMPWSLADLFARLAGDSSGGAIISGPARMLAIAPAPDLGAAVGWLAVAIGWAAGALVVLLRAFHAYRKALHAARIAP